MILYDNVASKGRAIGHPHVTAYVTIVADVCIGHEQAVIADGGRSLSLVRTGYGARANGDMFTDEIVGADNASAELAPIVLHILRHDSNLGATKETVVLADVRAPVDDAMRTDDGARSNTDVRADNCKGPDFGIVGNLGVRIDDGSGMYAHDCPVTEEGLSNDRSDYAG